jgi:hypothetical protein
MQIAKCAKGEAKINIRYRQSAYLPTCYTLRMMGFVLVAAYEVAYE